MKASRSVSVGTALALSFAGFLLLDAPAQAWSAELASEVSCNESTGVQQATFTLHNPEVESLTVVSADVFVAGTAVAAGGDASATTERPGDFTGTVTETVHVTWLSDGPLEFSATASFPGNCVSVATTTPTTDEVSPGSVTRPQTGEASGAMDVSSASVLGASVTAQATRPRFTG